MKNLIEFQPKRNSFRTFGENVCVSLKARPWALMLPSPAPNVVPEEAELTVDARAWTEADAQQKQCARCAGHGQSKTAPHYPEPSWDRGMWRTTYDGTATRAC